MKLRTAYGLKEQIKDGRKLTLQLEWQYLTTTEAKAAIAQTEQVLQAILGEQKMLFMGGAYFEKQRCLHGMIPWKARADVYRTVKGFVRTEESAFSQKQRIRQLQKEERKMERINVSPYYPNPYIRATKEEGIELARKYFAMEPKAAPVQGLPEEVTVCFAQRYCADGTYRIRFSISVSGYAIGYTLQNLTVEYKKQLLAVSKKTPLFAGYIFYENTEKGIYAYFHSCPEKVNGQPGRAFGLRGYEWAAYINKELAKELPGEQMERLQQLADVSSVENGIFYQMRCDILQYGPEEKQRCRDILNSILQPGYGYVSLMDLYKEQMPIPQTTIYLLQPKRCKEGQCSILGFYNNTTPEEAETSRFYNVIEEIKIS